MRIAIASGKGGTGKTTVATNLALAAARRGVRTAYFDCDVEEPNGQLFLKPRITSSRAATHLYPRVEESQCTHCGQCGAICQFSAIVCIGEKVLVYPELCHACGGCALVCPSGAITEVERPIGVVETGVAEAGADKTGSAQAGADQTGAAATLRFAQGTLRIGEAMSTPLIHQLKENIGAEDLAILDCPPGASCPVIESVRGADLVLLVTEPTPFGLNDLRLAVETLEAVGLPMAAVINRDGADSGRTRAFCQSKEIPVWTCIADDRRVAEAYSRGQLALDAVPAFRQAIEQILDRLLTDGIEAFRPESGAARR